MQRPFKIVVRATERDQNLSILFNEIRKYEPLTVKEELKLIKEAQAGSERARDLLVKHNLRFVISVAKSYNTKRNQLGDLINVGSMGLIKSIDLFKETNGVKFISYAVWHIRSAIGGYLESTDEMIKIPSNVQRKLKQIKTTLNNSLVSGDEITTAEDLIEGKDNEYGLNMVINTKTFSINAPYGSKNESDSDSSMTFEDMLENNLFVSPEDGYDKKYIKKRIFEYIEGLNYYEREIIKYYYGFYGFTYNTRIISEHLGLTKPKVDLKLKKTLRDMRENLELY
jgi:RNA polymerase primary sigma factor